MKKLPGGPLTSLFLFGLLITEKMRGTDRQTDIQMEFPEYIPDPPAGSGSSKNGFWSQFLFLVSGVVKC